MKLGVAIGLAALLASACGDESGATDDDDGQASNSASNSSSQSSSAASGGGGASSSATTGGGGTTSSSSSSGGGETYAPPDLQNDVFVGHYLGDFEIVGYGSDDLGELPGSPMAPGDPGGHVLGIPDLGRVVLTLEGGDAIRVYAAGDLAEVGYSPLSTAYGPVSVAHDPLHDRLYVYCIGTAGDPENSALTVYDTSAEPWTEIAGSPFHIDVPANHIVVDPVSERLFGISLGKLWAVSVESDGVSHLPGSPIDIDGTGAGLDIDPARRRLYAGERLFGQAAQKLYAYDVDSWTQIAGSPLSLPGSAAGDVVADPVTGHVFMVDFGDTLLHAVAPEPFASLAACGGGCPIPTTETGLALDHELGRLFIAHIPDLNNPDQGHGFMSVWDVSAPATPTEITGPGTRPPLLTYPNRLTAM